MFNNVDPKQSFPKLEEALLKVWDESKTFEKSVEQGEKDYVFYDGPPFATGLPHYGHILAHTIKDVIPRYFTMQGYRVERKWGWDCHGLPVENEVEKELNLGSKTDIEEYGIDKFNEACRSVVLRYAEEWKVIERRFGRWIDMENDYKTMDLSFMESVWWVFKSMWDKGLVYEGYKVVPYCPRCATPLSNFETNQGYQDKQDPALTVKFELKDEPGLYMLAWTTTPWTLPSNMALAVGPNVTYVKIKDLEKDEMYILAEDRLEALYASEDQYEILDRRQGNELEGKKYIPLMPYFADKTEEKIFTVTTGDFVAVDSGTGIVHMAPFGEDDIAVIQRLGIEPEDPIDAEAKFNELVPNYQGKTVFEANPDIIKQLKDENKIVKHETINHSYPHCWRCDSPLIYRPISTWFVAVEKIKDKMLKNNEEIHWVPGHIQEGRFGKWLEGARDWAISRNRYWGTPLPIWRSESGKLKIIGSKEELEQLTGETITDIHKHKIDHLTIEENGETYTRVPEVFDCWFESGSMPYAQLHYPFENKDKFEGNFPAQFIAEGLDQTRGWFYTLHVLATGLFDKPAFKNCIVNGIVLAEDGKKMSKRLKNYPDPTEIMNEYGADAMRFYMMNSPVVRADDMRFSAKGVEDVVRNFILPIWNAYSFFVTYANIDEWNPDNKTESTNKLDQWLLSRLNRLIEIEKESMEGYDLQKASGEIYEFVDDLTNWYIRRSRRRFWKSEDDNDKNAAYSTLHEALVKLCQIIAPFTPFVSEEIYMNLTKEESVHLSRYPEVNKALINEALESEIGMAKTIVSLGLASRAKKKIKVRQPLNKITVALGDQYDQTLLDDQLDTIKEELNVKDIEFVADASDLATVIAKPNAKVLGPKYGKDMQQIIMNAKQGNFEKLDNGNIKVLSFELTPEEIEIAYVSKEGVDVETDAGILVALDTEVTPELEEEGLARDLIRQIQELRKEADYNVDDRITLAISGASDSLLQNHGAFIQQETLATSIEADLESPDKETTYESIVIKIKR